jgi:hypothetical protein
MSDVAISSVAGIVGTLTAGVLGLIGGIVIERIRLSDARAARVEAREQASDDVQRATLIEFQEVLGRYVKAVGATDLHDRQARTAGRRGTRLGEELNAEVFETGRRLRQLALRIQDPQLRQLATQLRSLGVDVEIDHPGQPPKARMDKFIAALRELEDRLGEVLRPLL